MERIYGERFAHDDFFSREFHLGNFFTMAVRSVESYKPKRSKHNSFNVASNLSITLEEFNELSKKCDPSRLFPKVTRDGVSQKEGYKSKFSLYDGCSVSSNLEILKITKNEEMRNCRKKRTDLVETDIYETEISGTVNPKYRGEVELNYLSRLNGDEQRPKDLQSKVDGIVSVAVKSPNEFGSFAISQEFLLPSNMLLSSFKDRILCQEDFQFAQPLNPSSNVRKLHVNKFGMFYIGGNFYIDGRWGDDPGFDYSKNVIEWMNQKNIEAPHSPFKMEDTKIYNLNVRLGFPYLYQHQGSCEHQIIFTDARLMNKGDLPFMNVYPLMTSFATALGNYCTICSARIAKWLVTNCEILNLEYSALCNLCYFSFLHNELGNRKVPFVSYKYVDRIALLS